MAICKNVHEMCIQTQDVGESIRQLKSESTVHKVCAPECDRLEFAHMGVYACWAPLSPSLCRCFRLVHRTHAVPGACTSLRAFIQVCPPPPEAGPARPEASQGPLGKGRAGTHIAQVQDEAVTIVEALPGHGHLSGTDHMPPFDLEESLHHHFIGYHVLES